MKKIYVIKCNKYKKFKKTKISYLFNKKLVLSIICNKRDNNYEKKIREEKSVEILKIFGLINNMNE